MSAEPQRAARVLVVDDEHEIATTIAEVLDFEGCRVAVACAVEMRASAFHLERSF